MKVLLQKTNLLTFSIVGKPKAKNNN